MEALAFKEPENLESLTTVQYWDNRYKEEEHTEWLLDSKELGNRMEEVASRWGKEVKILHLGCGTSLLPQQLYQLGFTRVFNIDNSPVCISKMSRRFPHLLFELMDLNDLQYDEHTFDMVVEKSTLDTLISDRSEGQAEGKHKVEKCLQEISKVLRPGGILLSVSLLSPNEHSAILSPLGGRVKVERIRGGKDQVDCTVATVFFDDLKGDHVRGSVKQESCDDQNLPEYDFSDDEERFEGGVSDEYKDLVKSMIS